MPSAYRIEGNVLDLNCLFAIGLNMGILAVMLKRHFKHRETRKNTIKKVNWLLEKDIYDRESEVIEKLQKQRYNDISSSASISVHPPPSAVKIPK